MNFPGVKLLIFVLIATSLKFVIARTDNSQFIYLKSVKCQHNPKFLANVSCFAKSWSRTISRATIMATVKVPLTSVLVSEPQVSLFWYIFTKFGQTDYFMQYKYGTIYRDIMRLAYKIDFCWAVGNIVESNKNPLIKEFQRLMNDSVPGFIKPCPWKVIRE